MNTLYPLKFSPIFKHKIWGGTKLHSLLNKNVAGTDVGESWEISGVQDNISVVSNGFLEGNSLQELIEVYMGDLVGDSVYEKFGLEFPLLIKFIDANDVLSVQVHPDDELAKKRHKAYGKTEMWYVVQAEEKSELIVGFNKEMTKELYQKALSENTLKEILNVERVQENDCFFLPAGRIHAIGAGVLIAEIHQTSDITYRIFDWDRKDADGNTRELHTDWAVDAIDFDCANDSKQNYTLRNNKSTELISCTYFTTNLLEFDCSKDIDYSSLDSFVVYMCIEGEFHIETTTTEITSLKKGETVLIPVSIDAVTLHPKESAKILEVYIK